MIAQDRAQVIERLQAPPPPRQSSVFLMPQEPDAMWDLLLLELRHQELRDNLKTAQGAVAYSISQEIISNRRRAARLSDRLGVTGADLIALSYDTPPALMSLSFGPIDDEPNDTPPKAADFDDFVVSLRGRGLSFADSISARMEFKLAETLRAVTLKLSRRTEDWEFMEFTAQHALASLGFVTGTEAVVLLEMTLKSGRTVTRCLARFVCG